MTKFLKSVKKLLKKHDENVWKINMRLDHLLPQHYFTHKDGVSQVDVICKLENSENLMDTIEKLMPVKLKPHFNQRPVLASKKSKKYILTEKEKALIRDIYEKDFLIFGYDF